MNDSPWNCDYAAQPYTLKNGAAFDIGDIVSLRGQPQLMTVEDVCECGSISVVWFAGNEDDGWTGPHRDTFNEDMLINLDDDD